MPKELDRRQFIEAGSAGVLVTAAAGRSAFAAGSKGADGRSAMTYGIKPLPFDPKTVVGFSEKILVSHHENNYSGAVKRLNAITAELANLDWTAAPSFVVNGLKREELIAANSMILHEHFFAGFAGKDAAPEGTLADAIKRDFGSFDRWQAEFTAMGRAQGGGSGWVMLAYSQRDNRLINTWASDHSTMLSGGRPILVLDMYEHSYHMDFGAKAGAYVEAFMAAARWDNATRLFDIYRKES